MSRTATLSFSVALLVALSNPALAQIGMRTGIPEPVSAEDSEAEAEAEAMAEEEGLESCQDITGLLPLRPVSGENLADKTRCFWDQKDQEYLKYGRFVSTSKTVSATTEILSDAFGAVRLSLSTAVAATTGDEDDDGEEAEDGDGDEPTPEQDETLNLLAANGGNLALTASYPLYYQTFAGGKGGKFLWNSYLRAATNISALGSTGESTQDWEDVNGNVELAFTEMQLDLLSFQEAFNLLGYLKTSAIFGTDEFSETLHEDASKSFFHAQVGAGIRLGILMVYATYNWYSDGDIPGDGGTLTFTMAK